MARRCGIETRTPACGIRKVGPNARALADKRAWITGVRRDQSAQRAATPVIEWNAKFGLVKVAPLSGWTEAEIWDYIRHHDVPYNRLHDEGYRKPGLRHALHVASAAR